MKYIVVSGGVLSGIGKGVIASSTAVLMQTLGFRVTSIKIDPYINIDAGTMSPFEHGEVFVLDDGGEVDLDLGNYERFVGTTLTRDNNITTGKIYNSVIKKERVGDYLGKTVQVVPHIVDEIMEWVERVAHVPVDGSGLSPQICVIELGGTVGDIESMPFMEAMRQFQFHVGRENFCSVHVSLVPEMGPVGEQKTKPTQQNIRELRALGISPDIVACRSTKPLLKTSRDKISLFCQVASDCVLSVHDVSNVYRVPLLLNEQNFPKLLLNRLQMFSPTNAANKSLARIKEWQLMADKYDRISSPVLREREVHIALVGKYTLLSDAYLSVVNAFKHAAMEVDERVIVDFIDAEHLEPGSKEAKSEEFTSSWKLLRAAHGVLVPGAFGDRGIEGKILAVEYARTNGIPFLGICAGLQVAVVEICRNVLGLKGAHSSEFNQSAEHKVVIEMPEISQTILGGTMRLGKRRTVFKTQDCVIRKLYGNVDHVDERHRHRFEVNPAYVEQIEKGSGLMFVGQDETQMRMEIAELKNHPYFVGVQYHPEFKSRPLQPSPPFVGLIMAASGKLQKWLETGSVGPQGSLPEDGGLNVALDKLAIRKSC
eukprot:TRINITY_DN1406_c0_g1_i1.p1 TRINITY_DN1406_c0_g1~~TRINITY_DN1406_c0_g1_i1.p1  ORF type:complete len:597 (+),score=190.68 TRINITY_DN1406_c0_g1_i1:133-1923(+)